MKELNNFRKYLTEDKDQLNENAPGYSNRKFGHALPTLESIQSAYENKKEPRDGVKSAAEKLGMKPSHVREDSFSSGEDPNIDLYSNSFGGPGTDKRSGQVITDILQLIRDTGIDPMDVLEEVGQEFGISFEFGRSN